VSFVISKRFEFSASHLLAGLGDDHPCSRLHGHNYRVEVVAAAPDLDERGFVVDYHELSPLRDFLKATVDHRHLNDVVPGQPSAERIAWWIYEWCKGNLPHEVARRLVAVRVSETPSTWAEYRPEP
jgi:6-pyruvoyltetrahydropterin/6-carboxytetrahydropterin synthase